MSARRCGKSQKKLDVILAVKKESRMGERTSGRIRGVGVEYAEWLAEAEGVRWDIPSEVVRVSREKRGTMEELRKSAIAWRNGCDMRANACGGKESQSTLVTD